MLGKPLIVCDDRSARRALNVRRWRTVLLAVSLLLVGWQTHDNALSASAAGQSDRLTPLQREIQKQQRRLSSEEVEERRDALVRLGNLKRAEASRAAAAALNDRSESVRVAAAHAIGSLPPSEAASILIPLLKDKSEFVRREAAFALGETRDRSAVDSLRQMLQDKKFSVRASAAIALGNIGDESAVTALTEVLSGATGKKSTNSEQEFARRAAAKALGQIHSRAAVPALIAALENIGSASDTRREAATSLGLIGDAMALPALRAAVESASDPYLAEAARSAIKSIERKAK